MWLFASESDLDDMTDCPPWTFSIDASHISQLLGDVQCAKVAGSGLKADAVTWGSEPSSVGAVGRAFYKTSGFTLDMAVWLG